MRKKKKKKIKNFKKLKKNGKFYKDKIRGNITNCVIECFKSIKKNNLKF